MLAAAFVLLSAGALAPLFVTPILPFPDLPANVANASLLIRTALKQSSAEPFYRVEWLPFPYWTTYLDLGPLSIHIGPFLAAKVLVGVLVLALPLALMRLLLALGRDPRQALWGFLLSWEHNLYAGWHSYALAMALSFVILAKVVEAEDARAARRIVPWSVILGLTHVMGVMFLLVAALFLLAERRPAMTRAKVHAIAVSGSALILVPWLVLRMRFDETPPAESRFFAEYPTAAQKVVSFFAASLDNLNGPSGEGTAALALTLLVLGPLVFACLPQSANDRHRWAGALVALAALVLYAALPMAIYGPVAHWYTYPRYASYLLATLLLVPPVRRLPPSVLAPGVMAALAGNVATVTTFRAFGDRVRPFLQIVDAAPAGTRVLPLEYVDEDPAVKFAPLAHLHSYITAKGAYDPHLYDNPNTPIRYRSDLSIPRISWSGPSEFTLAKYGPHYDYILVQGLTRDPFVREPSAAGYCVNLVREAGMWRLYSVERIKEGVRPAGFE
jgi:hypothetical protein